MGKSILSTVGLGRQWLVIYFVLIIIVIINRRGKAVVCQQALA